ncbi:MAG: phosphoglucosamine mutase [Rhodanobacteraceae bacterium]|nr:phosphoglucosamine mutase [Rhodanobacteraceae bacterium]MBP6078171.1 phosphoglucosamine mutase [Xanthomonadales bacterium]MBP7623733.1 phosphoglucosamine mutase [Xanthomonadales bacterium]
MSNKTWFGTDGIRGHVGITPITAEFALRLGHAAGRVLAKSDGGVVVIGKDTRRSGYMLESALEAGLISAGADVRLLGPMPTPGVAHLTQAIGACAGVVISASHNPHHDNGFKFFSAKGEKLGDAEEFAIEAALAVAQSPVAPERLGRAARMTDADDRYLGFVAASVPAGFRLDGLRIVLDCAHGATYKLAPRLFSMLGASVNAIGITPDGLNINRGVGSTEPAALQAEVRDQRADLGIAFDGDGDRVLFVDAEGELLDGDDLLHILATEWHRNGRLRGPVVGTLMTNMALELKLAGQGIAFSRANVGDRYVHQRLHETSGVLGGEASGHVLCLDRAGTGDAMIAALQVLEALSASARSASEWRGDMPRFPQQTINVRFAAGARPLETAQVFAARATAEDALAGRGRLVLRASGTEPVIRVTVEADDAALVQRIAQAVAAAVSSAA